jgi:acylphosphatase
MAGSDVAVRVCVSGRVQGIGFRAECRRAAGKAGVTGWVRNLPDGRVEAWIEGERAAVERLAAWCGHGPSWSTVSSVEITDERPVGAVRFEVR